MADSDFRRGDAMLWAWAEKFPLMMRKSTGYPSETIEYRLIRGTTSPDTSPGRLNRTESCADKDGPEESTSAFIRQLPDELQDVIVARYLERMRYSEIARECRISRETARDRIYIAVMSVARRFQRAA